MPCILTLACLLLFLPVYAPLDLVACCQPCGFILLRSLDCACKLYFWVWALCYWAVTEVRWHNQNSLHDYLNSHDFKTRRARIVASLRCHSAGVIPNVTWPCLANSEGALAHRDTTPTSRKDRHTTTIPLEATTEEIYMHKLYTVCMYVQILAYHIEKRFRNYKSKQICIYFILYVYILYVHKHTNRQAGTWHWFWGHV